MVVKPCVGEAITNDVDEILDLKEDYISTAKGTGRITEDKYDILVDSINEIRSINNKIKCILETIPQSEVSPESLVKEIQSELTD